MKRADVELLVHDIFNTLEYSRLIDVFFEGREWKAPKYSDDLALVVDIVEAHMQDLQVAIENVVYEYGRDPISGWTADAVNKLRELAL